MNISIVFLVSGLWHGASWHFVLWGLVHAVFQIVGDLKRRRVNAKDKKENRIVSISERIRKIIITFILVDFAWIFFASSSIHMGIGIIFQMFSQIMTTSVLEVGFDKANWIIMICSIVILIVVDVLHERNISIRRVLNNQKIWLRIIFYNIFIWSIIMFGIYGAGYDASQFIYFQF